MWSVVGELLSPAVGVAVSPLPIAGVIFMLLSPNAMRLAPAFVVGWIVAIVATLAIITGFVDGDSMTDASDDPSALAVVIRFVLGGLLLFLAVQQFRKRPKPGETPEMPKWMKTIDSVSVPVALGFGAFMGGINPKNLLLNIAAATTIVQGNIDTGETIGSILIYTVLASLTVAVPLIWYIASPESAKVTLDRLKNWLSMNNAVVMSVLFLMLGVSQIGKGIGGL
ncbi:MAG: GAP family protein [Thermomicrobiales bacterium]